MQQPKSRQWNTEQNRLNSLPDASVARVLGGSGAKADVRALFADEHLLADSFSSDSAEGQPVEQALSLFDHLSSQLTSSYRDLEQKVHKLKHDLSEEELHRQEQLKEKEAIATRMETLLEILPAGVVLLDGKGCVSECNPAAVDLLGEPLEGQLWLGRHQALFCAET